MIVADKNSSGLLTKSGHIYLWGHDITRSEDDKDGYVVPTYIHHNRFSDDNNIVLRPYDYQNKEEFTKLNIGNCMAGIVTKNGKLYTWGYNLCTMLENGKQIRSLTPSLVPPEYFDGEQIIDIQMKNLQTGAITISGKLFIWGEVKKYYHIPILMPQSCFKHEKIIMLRFGDYHSGAITESGKLYMWGNNFDGQLGDCTFVSKSSPTLIPPDYFGGERIISLSLGKSNTGVITESGKLYLWGSTFDGILGVNSQKDKNYPVLIHPSAFDNEKIFALSIGSTHCGVITQSGKLYMWGRNKYGQLGIYEHCKNYEPTLIPQSTFNGEPIVEISLGDDYTLVRTSSNKLYACGRNQYGQLGIGNFQDRYKFEFVIDINNLI